LPEIRQAEPPALQLITRARNSQALAILAL
jgi:hypothetical protein